MRRWPQRAPRQYPLPSCCLQRCHARPENCSRFVHPGTRGTHLQSCMHAGCMRAQLDVRVHQLLGTCVLCHHEIRGHCQVDTNVRLTTLPGVSLTNRVQRRAQVFRHSQLLITLHVQQASVRTSNELVSTASQPKPTPWQLPQRVPSFAPSAKTCWLADGGS